MYHGLVLIKSTDLVQEMTRKYLRLDYDTIGYIEQIDETLYFFFKSVLTYQEVKELNTCTTWHDIIVHPYVSMLLYYPSKDPNIRSLIESIPSFTPAESILNIVTPLPLRFNISPYIANIPTCIYNKEAKLTVNKETLVTLNQAFFNLIQVDTFRKSFMMSTTESHQPYLEWVEALKDTYTSGTEIPIIALNDIIELVNYFTKSSVETLTHRDYKYAILSSDPLIDVETIGEQSINVDNPNIHNLSRDDLLKLRTALCSPPTCENDKYNNLRVYIDQRLIQRHV